MRRSTIATSLAISSGSSLATSSEPLNSRPLLRLDYAGSYRGRRNNGLRPINAGLDGAECLSGCVV